MNANQLVSDIVELFNETFHRDPSSLYEALYWADGAGLLTADEYCLVKRIASDPRTVFGL